MFFYNKTNVENHIESVSNTLFQEIEVTYFLNILKFFYIIKFSIIFLFKKK